MEQFRNVEGSGWIEFTPNSPFGLYDQSYECVYKKSGGIVEIHGSITSIEEIPADFTYRSFYTLPEGFRPRDEIITVCQGSGYEKFNLRIRRTGQCEIGRYGSSEGVKITPGTWLTIHTCFIAYSAS